MRTESAGREVDAGRKKLEMLKNIHEEGRSKSGRIAIVSRNGGEVAALSILGVWIT